MSVRILNGAESTFYDFDLSYQNGNIAGRLSWDQDNATAQIGLNQNVVARVAQDDMWYVKNQTGSSIPKGTVVSAVGTVGASGRILVAPSVGNGSVPAKFILGIAAETIADGADGYVISKGKLRSIDTSLYSAGDVLWLNPSVNGGLTATEPQAPNLKISIAFVVHSSVSAGVLAVRTDSGNDLYNDSRVQMIGTPSTGQLLRYNANRWENWSPNFVTTSRTINIAGTANQVNVVGGTQDLSGNRTWTLSLPQDIHESANPRFARLGIGTNNTVGALSISQSISFPNATNSDIDAWNNSNKSYLFLFGSNNALSIGVDNTSNSRTGWIQVGHSNTSFASASGNLRLQPLHGDVSIGLSEVATARLDIGGNIRIRILNNIAGDFVTADANGVLSRRTAAQTLSDIGASPASGSGNYIQNQSSVSQAASARINGTFRADTGFITGNWNTTTAFGLEISSSPSINYSIPTSFTGGWARGISYQRGGSGPREAGFGMLGSGANITSLYLAFGASPWASTTGIHLLPSGNVGIGTTAPAYKFNVITDAVAGRQNLAAINRTSGNFVTFTNPQYSVDASMGLMLRVFPQSDSRQGAGIIASGGALNGETDLSLFVSSGIGTSVSYGALNIKGDTGNVGIGTTLPLHKIHINTATGTLASLDNNDGAIWSTLTSAKSIGLSSGTNYGQGGNFTWIKLTGGASGNIIFAANNEAMRITRAGNVGIGTTSPSGKLEVAKGGEGLYLKVGGDNATNGRALEFSSSSNNGSVGALHTINATSGNGAISLNTAGVSRLFLDRLGNVGIGTTSPNAKLDVNSGAGAGSTDLLSLSRSSGFGMTTFNQAYDSTYFANGKTLTLKNDSGTAFIHFAGNNAGTQTNVLIPTGSVGIGTTTPSSIFDVNTSGQNNSFITIRQTGAGTNASPLLSGILFRATSSNHAKGLIASENRQSNVWNSDMVFYTINATAGAVTDLAERMRLLGVPGSSPVLQFNGASTIRTSTGNLTLATAGGNGNIVLSPNGAGNVGIGTAAPLTKVHVSGAGQTVANITDAGVRNSFLMITSSETSAGSGGAVVFGNSQSVTANSLGMAAIKASLTNGSGNTAGDLLFLTRSGTTQTEITERWRIISTGILQSNGAQTIRTSTGNLTLATNGGNGNIILLANGSGYVSINKTPSTTYRNLFLGGDNSGWNAGLTIQNDPTGDIWGIFGTTTDGFSIQRRDSAGLNPLDTIRILNNGNFGIGTTSPTEKLHVNGNGAYSGMVYLGTGTKSGIVGKLEIAYDGAANGIGIFDGTGLSFRIFRDSNNAIFQRGNTPALTINASSRLLPATDVDGAATNGLFLNGGGVMVSRTLGTGAFFDETRFAVNRLGGNITTNAAIDSNTLRNGMYRVNNGVTSSPSSAGFWALNVYGNESNVVSQLASHFQSGETFIRSYNQTWSTWRKVWDSGNFTPANYLTVSTAASTYEPIFSKNTAFNKNFGTTAGTVAEGNDSRIVNGQTAFGWGNHAGLYVPLARTITINGTEEVSATLGANRTFHVDRVIRRRGVDNLTNFNSAQVDGAMTVWDGNWFGTSTRTNFPIGGNNGSGFGLLVSASNVTAASDALMQTWYRNDSTSSVYVRTGFNGGYNGWTRLWGSLDFTSTNVSNWNTAFGWGNHANLYPSKTLAAYSVLGRATGTSGDMAAITAGTHQVLNRGASGNLLFSKLGGGHLEDQAVAGSKIKDGAVTYSKIQGITADRLLGRLSTTGVVQELTSAQVLTLLGIQNNVVPNDIVCMTLTANEVFTTGDLVIPYDSAYTDPTTRYETGGYISVNEGEEWTFTTRVTVTAGATPVAFFTVQIFGADSDKVAVEPYGANINMGTISGTTVVVNVSCIVKIPSGTDFVGVRILNAQSQSRTITSGRHLNGFEGKRIK